MIARPAGEPAGLSTSGQLSAASYRRNRLGSEVQASELDGTSTKLSLFCPQVWAL